MSSDRSPLDILFLVPGWIHGKGGIERLALYLSREFAAQAPEIRLHMVTTRWSERPWLKHLSTASALVGFIGSCLRRRGAVVHVNIAPRGSTYRKRIFWLVARALGHPTLLHLHGSGYDEFYRSRGRRSRQAIRRMFQAADHVVVLGDHWHAFVTGELGVPPDRVSIVPNGVPEPPRSREARLEPPLLVTMGAVGERKGTDVLIDALAALPKDLGWRAVVGGNGDLAPWREAARKAGIGDRIEFTGWLGEAAVGQWLDRGSIFVLPSRAENQPVAILEAMARGLPVVSTRIGAIPEQVIDGETGLLVPPGESAPLAEALHALLASPDRRAAMGAAGRAQYAERFSIANCMESLRALYHALAVRG